MPEENSSGADTGIDVGKGTEHLFLDESKAICHWFWNLLSTAQGGTHDFIGLGADR